MSYRRLPAHNLSVTGGVATFLTGEVVAGVALRVGQNVDSFVKLRGLGQTPGSTRVSQDHGAVVTSLHYFEYTTLAGARDRQVLSVDADGDFTQIADPSTLTAITLPTGATLAGAAMAGVTQLDRIHLTGENESRLVTGGLKYDGVRCTNWGCLAPGLEPNTVHEVNDHTAWADSTDATSSTSSTSIDGAANSVAVAKDGTSGTECSMTDTLGAGVDLSSIGEDTLYVWLFLPSGVLQQLATSGAAVTVSLGEDGTDNDEHQFSVGVLVPGWNLLSMVLTSPDAQNGAGATLSDVDWFKLELTASGASETWSGVLWDHIFYYTEGRLTAAQGSAGSITGTLTYRVAFLTEYGLETNAGPASASYTAAAAAASEDLDFSAQPTGAAHATGTVVDGGGSVAASDTITIDGVVYTFFATPANPYDVDVGADDETSLKNLARAINGGGISGTTYGIGTTQHPTVSAEVTSATTLTLTARSYGTGGNSIAVSETFTGSWTTDANLAGGVAGDTVTIGGTVYTFVDVTGGEAYDAAYDVDIGADQAAAEANLTAAINASGTAGTEYAADTAQHSTCSATDGSGTVTVTARTSGTDGNSIAVSESSSSLAWSGGAANLSGGRSGDDISLSALPVSTDDQVIARRIYRDLDGDAIWRFVAQIDDNSTTTYTDQVTAASLGTTTPPVAGDDILDATPPSRMRDVALHEARVVGIDGANPTVIHVSDVNYPEAFPVVLQLTLEHEATALLDHPLGTIIATSDRDFLLSGNGSTSPMTVEILNPEGGQDGFRAGTSVGGLPISVREGRVLYKAQPSDPWVLNTPVLDQWNDTLMPGATLSSGFVLHDRARWRVLFFEPAADADYDPIWVYQYGSTAPAQITGDGAGIDPTDPRTGVWYTMSLPATVNPQCGAIVENTADRPELWVGGEDGYVYFIGDPTKYTWAENTGTAAISSNITFHDVPLGMATAGRGEPRYLRLNTDSDNGAVLTIQVDVLADADGDSLGNASKSHTVAAGSNSYIVGLPAVGVLGEWCRVAITNAVSGEDFVIKSSVLYYLPRGQFRGVR